MAGRCETVRWQATCATNKKPPRNVHHVQSPQQRQHLHPTNAKTGPSWGPRNRRLLGTPIHQIFGFIGISGERYLFLTFTNVHDVHRAFSMCSLEGIAERGNVHPDVHTAHVSTTYGKYIAPASLSCQRTADRRSPVGPKARNFRICFALLPHLEINCKMVFEKFSPLRFKDLRVRLHDQPGPADAASCGLMEYFRRSCPKLR
jgi:hypothetical protein